MSKVYQAQLIALLDQLELDLEPDLELQVKPFFGGAAAYSNGRICLSLTKVGLALKLPPADRQTLLAQGGAPLRYFARAPVKKQYVLLPPDLVDDRARLRPWVRRCILSTAAAQA